jgi:ketosteroid isomerase-like protein
MPSRARVEAFIKTVEAGDFVGALEEFYAEDATMRENADPPRQGLSALIAHEKGLLAAFRAIAARPASRHALDGDTVVINWVFDFTAHDGSTITLDELALQRWRGERIAEERFYYDTRPFARRAAR